MMSDQERQAVQKRLTFLIDGELNRARTVRDIWLLYQASTISPRASDVQRQECRWAFYAGAAAMLELCTRLGDPALDEDTGAGQLMALQREMERFAQNLRDGLV